MMNELSIKETGKKDEEVEVVEEGVEHDGFGFSGDCNKHETMEIRLDGKALDSADKGSDSAEDAIEFNL